MNAACVKFPIRMTSHCYFWEPDVSTWPKAAARCKAVSPNASCKSWGFVMPKDEAPYAANVIHAVACCGAMGMPTPRASKIKRNFG